MSNLKFVHLSGSEFYYNQSKLVNWTRYPFYRGVVTSHPKLEFINNEDDTDLMILLLSLIPLLIGLSWIVYKLLLMALRPKRVRGALEEFLSGRNGRQLAPRKVLLEMSEEVHTELNDRAQGLFEVDRFEDLSRDDMEDLLIDIKEEFHRLQGGDIRQRFLKGVVRLISVTPTALYCVIVFAMCIASCSAITVTELMDRRYETILGRRTNPGICSCSGDQVICAGDCSSVPEVLSPTAFYSYKEVEVVKVNDIEAIHSVKCIGGSGTAKEWVDYFQDKGLPYVTSKDKCGVYCVFGLSESVYGLNLAYDIIKTKQYQYTGIISDNADILGTFNPEDYVFDVTADGLECPQGFILIENVMYCIDATGKIGNNMWVHNSNFTIGQEWESHNGQLGWSCEGGPAVIPTTGYPFSGDCSFVAYAKSSSNAKLADACAATKWRLCDDQIHMVGSEDNYMMDIPACVHDGTTFTNKFYSREYVTSNCIFDPTGASSGPVSGECGVQTTTVEPTLESSIEVPKVKWWRIGVLAILLCVTAVAIIIIIVK